MTSKELKKQVEEMKKITKKATSSKEYARELLASTKVYTSAGQLKKSFR
jgi:cell fate (sporulation/competence/biofilm development) regulator YmcA (YheA/YmcA/DUF963 family)